jgi:hypothetical protein
MARFYLTFPFLCFLSIPIFAQVRYVTITGAGTMDGTSWANAYPAGSLQQAIDESTGEVWVAAGVYRTTAGTDRTSSFHMRNEVAIYGSFTGTETQLSQRTLSHGLTSTLTAEIGAAGISDNSYHTIHNTGLTNSASIDGFIITGANDNRAATETEGLGGGIYNSGNGSICSPTIRNCVIINNRAVFGAGIFNSGYLGGVASPVITNCVIAFNTATSGGGGVDNFGLAGTASPTITNTIFYENTATERAGAMYCWGGNNGNASPVVINSVFVNNNAVDGGAIVSDRLNSGGGSSGSSDPVFKNCIFRGNEAAGTGPQFFLLGSATFNSTYSAIDLTAQTAPHVITGAGTGNVSGDPMFMNIALGAGTDSQWLTADDGLQLQASSPCIDQGNNAGVPATDILSTNRIINTTVDMGAYEREAGLVTAREPETNINGASFYPNPASHTITFSGLARGENVSLFTLQGTRVTGSLIHENELDISQLAEGAYILMVESDKKLLVRKLVIKR